ncbi:hypothetical protein BH11PSE13_BH11PSE13_16140 [soil metagenome]
MSKGRRIRSITSESLLMKPPLLCSVAPQAQPFKVAGIGLAVFLLTVGATAPVHAAPSTTAIPTPASPRSRSTPAARRSNAWRASWPAAGRSPLLACPQRSTCKACRCRRTRRCDSAKPRCSPNHVRCRQGAAPTRSTRASANWKTRRRRCRPKPTLSGSSRATSKALRAVVTGAVRTPQASVLPWMPETSHPSPMHCGVLARTPCKSST